MDQNEFVDAINQVVVADSINAMESTLLQPAGRSPEKSKVEMSLWYNSLDARSREMVLRVVKESVEMSAFSFLCVIDGVSAIEGFGEKGKLLLQYVSPTGNTILLNDPEQEYLHDLL
jgi:hypothetical protein